LEEQILLEEERLLAGKRIFLKDNTESFYQKKKKLLKRLGYSISGDCSIKEK